MPVQRVPRREADILRFFQWIRQFGDIYGDIVERHVRAPLQPQETHQQAATRLGADGDEHPSSSTDPAPMARALSRSRSRSRSSRESEAEGAPASHSEDEEARTMYEATLRGDPPSLPSWARPGTAPVDLPGIWWEHEEDLETTTSTTSSTMTTLVSDFDEVPEELVVSTSSSSSPPVALDPVPGGVTFGFVWTTTTTSTSSSVLWPEDVVRDVVNLQAILASHGDRDQILWRLLDRQRYLQHEQRLLQAAVDELVHWMGPPVTAVSFNGATMERNIRQAVGREAQFGSGSSSSSTNRLAMTPTFLLTPGLYQNLCHRCGANSLRRLQGPQLLATDAEFGVHMSAICMQEKVDPCLFQMRTVTLRILSSSSFSRMSQPRWVNCQRGRDLLDYVVLITRDGTADGAIGNHGLDLYYANDHNELDHGLLQKFKVKLFKVKLLVLLRLVYVPW